MDGVSVYDFKQLPKEGVHAFARLCHKILLTGSYPDTWFNVRVVLIPKKLACTALKDLRPLVIAPVAYRLFGKALLMLSQHAIHNVHAHSVGGVPKRAAQCAFLKVCMLIEQCRSDGSSLMGAAIDTQKFFDAVPFALAIKCLLEVGLPPIVVHTWGAFITRIRRYVSIQNSIGSLPIYCDRGIPQGDPISMFAAAAALGLWLDSLYKIPAAPSSEAWVFVDDRLLVSKVSPQSCWAQAAFSHTEFWDSSWRFVTRPKTVCFGFGPHSSVLFWSDGTAVSSQVDPVYLGIPLPMPKVSRTSFFQPIVEDCIFLLSTSAQAVLLLGTGPLAWSAIGGQAFSLPPGPLFQLLF